MPYHVGDKVKDKHAGRIAAVTTAALVEGEELLGIYWTNRLRPLADVFVVTSYRVMSAHTSDFCLDPPILGEQITRVQVKNRPGALAAVGELKLELRGDRSVKFPVRKADIQRLEDDIKSIAGKPSPLSQALAQQEQAVTDRDAAIGGVMTGRVGNKALDEIRKLCGPGEAPEFVIGQGAAGCLVAFTDRCVIVKKGALTGLMAGSTGGGRVATFMYTQITGVEYNTGWTTGVLEILTPSYQGSANKDFWRGSAKGTNADSNNPWTLSNTLPLAKPLYEQSRPQLDRMREMIAEAKRPVVQVAALAAPPAIGLASEIAKLAELHQTGALDDDEFRQAKQALIAGSKDSGEPPRSGPSHEQLP